MDGKFYIGNKEAKVKENNIIVGNKEYAGTPGLWELIVARSPDDKTFTNGDYDNYAEIMHSTNALRRIIIIIIIIIIPGQFIKRRKWWFGPPHQWRFDILTMTVESAVISTRLTSATLHLHVQAATNYTPITVLAIIIPDLSPVPIYRPRKDL